MNMINRLVNLRLSDLCFIIFFLLKPFYLFPSGSIQIADCFLILSFGVTVYESGHCHIKKIDRIFGLFLGCVIFINVVYLLIYQKFDFVKTCLFFVFNYLVIICFRRFIQIKDNLSFFEKVCKINLWIQLLWFVSGIKECWYGGYRYMGTYNDPNQFGFAIITTLSFLFLLDAKNKLFYVLVSLFLIYQSASTGILVTILILLVTDMLFHFPKRKKRYTFSLMLIIIILFVFFVIN